MKNLLFFVFLFVFNISFCQVPEEFNVLTINDVDSALYILTKAARSQPKTPTSIDVTKDYISQERAGKKMNALTGNVRTTTTAKANYYENITRITVTKGWRIYFYSSITRTSDFIDIKNKELAEMTYAALLCLVRNSSNNHYETIVNPPPKEKNRIQKLFEKKEVDSSRVSNNL
ncbi:MAG: hypothetical protein LLF93_06045 [Bacteroidales bacterium]|nr:hypothetical protein [Bacteroidales bacterium]